MNLAADTGRLLFELVDAVGNSLSLDETLREFDDRLKPLIDYDAIAVWLPRGERLAPAYIRGDDARTLCSLEIPLNDRSRLQKGYPAGVLQSVMELALEHAGQLTGVVALYHQNSEAFADEDLEILQKVATKLSAAIENATRHERAERLAAVDPATLLPNERALFQRLDAELARCRRSGGSLAVVVCEPGGGPSPLASVAAGLRRICREEDSVARMGTGFVLLLANFQSRYLPEKRNAIESVFLEYGMPVRIGYALHPEDGADPDQLLALAGRRAHEAE